MITTYRVPFSHDDRNAAEHFAGFAELFADSLGARPLTVSKPLLTYRARKDRAWQELPSLLDTHSSAIVYLCDIEVYATVLVSAPAIPQILGYQPFNSYTSFSDLLSLPRMVGYGIPDDFETTFTVPPDHFLLGSLPYCSLDEQTDEPNPEWFDVLDKLQTNHGPVYTYKIRSDKNCLKTIVQNSETTYFLPNSKLARLQEYAIRYHSFDDYLTDYLLRNGTPFGTINDGHQDDNFAVAYHEDIWLLGDIHRTIIA